MRVLCSFACVCACSFFSLYVCVFCVDSLVRFFVRDSFVYLKKESTREKRKRKMYKICMLDRIMCPTGMKPQKTKHSIPSARKWSENHRLSVPHTRSLLLRYCPLPRLLQGFSPPGYPPNIEKPTSKTISRKNQNKRNPNVAFVFEY